jgi:hypothetical protein
MTFQFTATLPSLDMTPAAFDAATERLVQDLPAFASAMNDHESAAESSASAAVAAAAAAAGSANFAGAWASLTGPLAIPASVSHGGTVWVLVASVADVTAHTPGVSANWVRSYPQRRVPIFDASTLALTPWGNNEVLHNAIASPLLTAANVVANGSTLVACPSGTTSNVAQSADGGRTWTLRSLPASGTWHIISDGTTFVAIRDAATGATATAWSTDGITWTGFTFGDTWGTTIGAVVAGGGGRYISRLASGLITVASGGAPTSWSTGQTAPGTITGTFVTTAGLYVARTATASYYTSATGLVGSWTGRTMPGTTDTMVQAADGSLLAYKAGDLAVHIHRSTDGINWTDTGVQLVHATAGVQLVNGIYLCGPVSGGATAWTRHGALWVPRTSQCAPAATPRQAAKVGSAHVLISGGLAHAIDPAVGDAAMSTWE